MLTSSMPRTVYDAIWEDRKAMTRCRSCGSQRLLDLHQLVLEGHGCNPFLDIPFTCSCGSTDVGVLEKPEQSAA